jgi:arylsulfatase A-like enzyme
VDAQQTEKEVKRPNILFMHVDQMHWEAMSGYGNPHVRTPGMDRIAADGCSFRASYASMPQCVPARTCWYTGRTSCETGAPTNGDACRPDIPDLGQWLRKQGGYSAAYAGKWHVNGRDVAKSFDLIFGKPIGKGDYIDGAVARACMGFLDSYEDDKPFFLNAGFLNPHDCCYTCGARGGQGKFSLAEDIKDQLPPLPKNWKPPVKKGKFTSGWSETQWRYYIYSYYRLVEMVDAEIASLYDALKNSRFADNTVVIFTADHGDGVGFHGNVSKGYMEEEAWRVPMIVVDPSGGSKGKIDLEHLSIGVDIPATICDYAQVPMMPKMTVAKSLKPLVDGKQVDDWHDYVVGESFHGQQVAVRDAQHKTIFYCNPEMQTKVFDLNADPLEMKNLVDTPDGKTIIEKHKKRILTYLDAVEIYEPPGKQKKETHERYLNYYKKLREEA